MNWDIVISVGLKIVAVIALVLMNGFFVATEFALVKVRSTQLETFAARKKKRAIMALHLVRHLDAYLSACQLGITLASLGLGWIGEPVFVTLLQPVFDLFHVQSEAVRHSVSIGVGFSVITFLHIVAGEMAPKTLAIRLALPTAQWVSYPMHWFYLVMFPFIWALNQSSIHLLRWLGMEPAGEHDHAYSEEELRLLIQPSGRPGNISGAERNLVLNALDLRRRTVREVMRPRQEITPLSLDASIAECLDVADKTRYSRFPLCEHGDLDRTRGVVHIKDLYSMRLKARSGADLLPVAKKLIYVPETARLERLLQLFLERRLHLALVVDEFGGTLGLISLENILEEVVGQIQDEFDQEKPLLTSAGEGAWDADGALPLHELSELVGENLVEEGVTTASGWVTQKLGGFPKDGDVIAVGEFQLRVEEMEGMRVARLKIIRNASPVVSPAADI
ncbi:MAG: hemolysin family protein [Verrucomicrobiota bacterium]